MLCCGNSGFSYIPLKNVGILILAGNCLGWSYTVNSGVAAQNSVQLVYPQLSCLDPALPV